MDAGHWSKGSGVVKSMEEKKNIIRPQKPQALNCPRCNSTHTKFCYYNNYSLSQPRYFCKTCRRYWTDGGSLRNVPVGGGSRRNKRSSSSSSSSSSVSASAAAAAAISKTQYQMMAPPVASFITQNPSKTIIQGQGQSQAQGQDLNLGYTNISLQFGNLPYNPITTTTTTTSSSSSQFSAMEFLKSGLISDHSRDQVMMNSLPNTMIMNPPAASLNFGFENGGGGYHHHHQHLHLQGGGGVSNHQGTMSTITTTAGTSVNGRTLFPFQDLKAVSTSNSELFEATTTKGQGESSTGYWGTGELEGGSCGVKILASTSHHLHEGN